VSGDGPEGMKSVGLIDDIIKSLLRLKVIRVFMEISTSQHKGLESIKIVTTFVRSVPMTKFQVLGQRL
jgi:hypothetical protein